MVTDKVVLEDNDSTIEVKLTELYVEFDCECMANPYSNEEDNLIDLYIRRSDKKTLNRLIKLLQKAVGDE